MSSGIPCGKTCIIEYGHKSVEYLSTISTYFFPVVTFVTVVDAITIVVEFNLEPGNEKPAEHHAAVNVVSLDQHNNVGNTSIILTAVGCCQDHTSQRPHLNQGGFRSLERNIVRAVTMQFLA